MVDLMVMREQMRDPDLDADDRERLLLDAMERSLRTLIAARSFDGDVLGALHACGFHAEEARAHADEIGRRVLGRAPEPPAGAGRILAPGLLAGAFTSVVVMGAWLALPQPVGAGPSSDRLAELLCAPPRWTFLDGLMLGSGGVALVLAAAIVLGLSAFSHTPSDFDEPYDDQNPPGDVTEPRVSPVDPAWGDR